MAVPLASLDIEVSAGSAKLKTDMDRITSIVNSSSNDIKSKMGGVADVIKNSVGKSMEGIGLNAEGLVGKLGGIGLAVTGIGAAAGGVAALGAAFNASVKNASELYDISLKTGASVESLSALQPVAKLAGSNVEEVSGALVKLSKNLEATGGMSKNTSDALKRLGISVKDIAGKDSAEQLYVIAKGLETMGSGSAKAAVATELLGKAGAQQLPFLKELAEKGLDNVKITTEQAIAAKQYEQGLIQLSIAKDKLTKKIGMEMIPAGNALISMFNDAVASENGLGQSSEKLAKDGHVKNWAFEGGKAVASLIDILVAAKDATMLVASGLAGAIRVTKAALSGGDIQAALDTTKNQFNEYKGNLANFDRFSQDYVKKFETNKGKLADAMDFTGTNGGKTANAAGDAFLKLLEARSKKLEEGEYSLLRYQAIEKGVADAAGPLIDAIKRLDETKQTDAWAQGLKLQNDQMDFQITLVGKTAKEIEILNVQQKNSIALEQKLIELQKTKGEVSADAIASMRRSTDEATQYQIDAIKRRQMAEEDWSTGATLAFKKYAEDAQNAGTMAQQSISNGMRGAEDALVSLCTTGKADFTKFANSIISDMMRMYIRAALLAPLMKSMGFGGATGAAAAPMPNANGNVFSGGRVQAFANGGVVGQPTTFGMAGGGTGLMGEAGPEAIMPLARDGSGKLGVRGAASNININVVNEGGKDGYQASATARQNDNGIDIDVMVRKAVSSDLRNNGPMAQQMSSVFGLKRNS